MLHIDLNADLAEACPHDAAIIPHVTSANIACALHAGSPLDMARALAAAKKHGTRIGAHPSFPDREHFGRAQNHMALEDVAHCLTYQLGAIDAMCRREGVVLSYVKAHGALYNQAAKDDQLAACIAKTVREFNPQLKLMGLAGSLMLSVAEDLGVATISEIFADRRYLADGSLVPRTDSRALIHDENAAIEQVLQALTRGTINTVEGGHMVVKADSVCLHGDSETAVVFAQKIRAALEENGVRVQAEPEV